MTVKFLLRRIGNYPALEVGFRDLGLQLNEERSLAWLATEFIIEEETFIVKHPCFVSADKRMADDLDFLRKLRLDWEAWTVDDGVNPVKWVDRKSNG